MSSQTMTGRTIAGRYQVTGYLRPGRMGDVYVARRLEDNARVAIKLLDPALFGEQEVVARFEREARITRTLKHPCVLQLLDHGRDEGAPWMVVEYVDGDPLSDVLEESGALDPIRAARITGQVALALQAAHAIGAVHRDLQPMNVLLTGSGADEAVKVQEFGLSRLEVGTETTLTAVGVRIGTPTYMAPEYIEEYDLDHRADLYSLGVMLYEMLVGEPPFRGRPYKVMDLHLTAPVPRPSERVPSVPGWLDELVLGLMAKHPDDRPTVEALLEAIAQKTGSQVKAAPRRRRAAPVQAPPPEAPRQPEKDPILDYIIRQNTVSVRTIRGPAPDPADCLVVERVGDGSLADEAGVRPGWLLHLPDEPVQGLRSTWLYNAVVERRRYVFCPPGSDEQLELVTTGIPIGVELMRTVEHVRAHYAVNSDPSALLDLWKQRAWPVLEEMAWKTLSQRKSGGLAGGLFARFLGGGQAATITVRNHPALVMFAAALAEQGKPGWKDLVDEYRSQHASWWPSAYNAIAHYYLGWERAKVRPDQDAADLLWESFTAHPLEPTAVALELLLRRKPEVSRWLGSAFPHYSLETVDARGGARLDHTLASMDDAQLLLVCMLGGFRGTLEYDAFMRRYLVFVPWFPQLIYGLHVITTKTTREDDRPQHYRGEDLVLHAGLRVEVLEDLMAFVQRKVKPITIPTVYAIDKEGVIVHEGPLLAADLWEALALAGRRRMERFR